MSESATPWADDTSAQTTLSAVWEWIAADDNIIKTQPLKQGQTCTYHISIKGKILSVNTAGLVGGQGAFNTMFADLFAVLLPKKDDRWEKFITYIMQNAKDGGLEENTASIAADVIFYKMCSEMEISDDRSVLIDSDENLFFRHIPHGDKTVYAVSSDLMLTKLNESTIKTTIADLSEAMTAKGYKVGNTFKIKVPSKPKPESVRCWYFIADQVEENRGDFE